MPRAPSWLCTVFGLAAACRPAATPRELVASRSPDPLDELRKDCAAGVLRACDDFELRRAICLQIPEGPVCDRMRERGELPPEPPPLSDAFGCRPTQGPIGPHATVCLSQQRLSVRYAGGTWEQWRIEGWQRDDTVQRVIWVASVVDGPSLWLTPVPSPEPVSPLAGPAPPVLAYHVVGEGGLLHATLGPRDAEAEDERTRWPDLDDVCRHADACERAMQAAREAATVRPAPAGDEEEAIGPESPPIAKPHTLRACHERWSAAAYDGLALTLEPTLPIECGTMQGEPGWPGPVPIPPYAWPEPPSW